MDADQLSDELGNAESEFLRNRRGIVALSMIASASMGLAAVTSHL